MRAEKIKRSKLCCRQAVFYVGNYLPTCVQSRYTSSLQPRPPLLRNRITTTAPTDMAQTWRKTDHKKLTGIFVENCSIFFGAHTDQRIVRNRHVPKEHSG